ncbi:XdhC family protein [Rhizorhapis sp. SPR117]|uniref:XdhC family protein n=1 Tax=Rhizorhapis sp. SPR117 TaxID=2912611 RepID=UPI001F3A8AB6|nr:XdhC family protein [Rhizorhapis sp. SPR117]
MQLKDADWPTFGWTTDMRPSLRDAREAGRNVVLATLVRIDGPSPRPPGSQMLFDGAKAVGYFSGGCVEADVANHAQTVLQNGTPKWLVYGQGGPWIDIRLLCGGTLEIALERIDPDDDAVAALLDLSRRRQPARWISGNSGHRVEAAGPLVPAVTHQGEEYALRHDPPYRVIIVGGDPFGLAMASLSVSAGFETIIVHPGGPSDPPPIPNVVYRREPPAAAIEALIPDRWTAVVTATHDEELDDAAVITALNAETSYVGVLGSVSRTEARRQRLLRAGLEPTKMSALHAPIGAARCGKAPWEVAVSVLAEIMQVRTDQSAL